MNSQILQPERKNFDSFESSSKTFRKYMTNIEKILRSTDASQAQILQKKYRFYLTKFKKLIQTMQKLKEESENLDQTIMNSIPVQEELKSIKFVEMISTQTLGKLTFFGILMTTAKQTKKKSLEYILNLKKIINQKKATFFQLKKEESKIKFEIQKKIQLKVKEENQLLFKNIKTEHKEKSNWKIRSLQTNFQKKNEEPSTSFNYFNTELEKVQQIKKAYLKLTSSKQTSFLSRTTNSFQSRKKSKKKVFSQKNENFFISKKSDCEPQSSQLLITNDLMEKFSQKEENRRIFHQLEFSEVLELICALNKRTQVEELIQKQKKNLYYRTSFF